MKIGILSLTILFFIGVAEAHLGAGEDVVVKGYLVDFGHSLSKLVRFKNFREFHRE